MCAGGMRGQGELFGGLHKGLRRPAGVVDDEQVSEHCGGPSPRSPILVTLPWWPYQGLVDGRGQL